jgi:Tol biopolymer transport system component
MSPTFSRPILAACSFVAVGLAAGCMTSEPFESKRDYVSPIADARDPTPRVESTVTPVVDREAVTQFGNIEAISTPLDAGGPNAFGEFDGEGERPYVPVAGRAGYQQHTYVDEGFDTDVTVSPDGSSIAFASTRHSTRSDLYLQSTSGLAVTKLTTDPADDAFPAFSPDGNRIAFCSNRSGNWDVYVMDRDGRNVTAITQGTGHDLHPSFSPDGTRLVFCRIGSRSQQWELWTADLTTGEKTMIGFGLFPDWSPRMDQDVIAFQRARQRGGRWFSLWTLELDGNEPTNVTEVAMSTNAALVAPAWSPDGGKIAFATVVEPGAGMPDTDSAVGRQDIWTVDADGTNRHRITDGKGTYATPSWAGDGRVYFVSDRGGTECIWSARADAANLSRMAQKPKTLDKQPTLPPFANSNQDTID